MDWKKVTKRGSSRTTPRYAAHEMRAISAIVSRHSCGRAGRAVSAGVGGEALARESVGAETQGHAKLARPHRWQAGLQRDDETFCALPIALCMRADAWSAQLDPHERQAQQTKQQAHGLCS